jgi:hypothetical protein
MLQYKTEPIKAGCPASTGAIFGDHVAIAATTLNNGEETINGVTSAAVIAARDQLDIGAYTITNRNDALIFRNNRGRTTNTNKK